VPCACASLRRRRREAQAQGTRVAFSNTRAFAFGERSAASQPREAPYIVCVAEGERHKRLHRRCTAEGEEIRRFSSLRLRRRAERLGATLLFSSLLFSSLLFSSLGEETRRERRESVDERGERYPALFHRSKSNPPITDSYGKRVCLCKCIYIYIYINIYVYLYIYV